LWNYIIIPGGGNCETFHSFHWFLLEFSRNYLLIYNVFHSTNTASKNTRNVSNEFLDSWTILRFVKRLRNARLRVVNVSRVRARNPVIETLCHCAHYCSDSPYTYKRIRVVTYRTQPYWRRARLFPTGWWTGSNQHR